ncbi:Ger(x)C family spore germination protein [Paenibacillus polysaccharolyticus]|uniref:Ger(x)C family spore germination protein n=1 Tax=Paenibacillus polysaccharolyticus TaxID=582692 RepID=UPI00280B5B84|nr:Ger(x)C family spore germination protein [Paenibacillus polysaccharolyticus]MDP9702251.1 Ger(x)C family germination protein [Paenibacillus intestini]
MSNLLPCWLQRWLLSLLSLLLCIMTTGCWSAYEIQQVDYAKAIGIEYKDGMYHIYVQTLDFSSIAKTDNSGKSSESPPIWVGHAQGKTMSLAMNELWRASQLHIAWGHVTAIVMAESVLNNQHIKDVFDMLGRFPEARYTTWVYGTREPLLDILSTASIYNLSPLDSILHNPLPSYMENSLFAPVLSFELIAKHNDPATTTYLPVIALNKDLWLQNKKEHDLFLIEGAYFERMGEKFNFLSRDELSGYHWLIKGMRRAPLLVQKNGVIYGALSVGLPTIKIEPIIRGEKVTFRIDAKYLTALYEYLVPMTYDEMTQVSVDTLKEQIMETYRNGLKRGVDVYGLQEKLYRKNPKLWHKLSGDGENLILTEDSIETLNIHLTIPYTGKYKRKV